MKHLHWITGMPALVLGGVLIPQLVSAQLPNAWQVNDETNNAALSYYTNLPSNVQQMATNQSGGWSFTVNSRFASDLGEGNETMAMIYGDGVRRWEILWSLTHGDLQAYLYNNGGTYVVTTNGNGTNLYHTHQIIYDPTNQTASYLVDGQALTTNWKGSTAPWPAGRVTWGAVSGGGVGVMHFHSIHFQVANTNAAAYDAEDAPASPPDPAGQEWTLSTAAPPSGTSTNAVSADAVPLPGTPKVTTMAPAEVEPYHATLAGVVHSGGLAASAWFEWGTTTNYGNTTAPRFLRADTNAVQFSQSLTGLAKGTTYHFRCAADTIWGVAYGDDVLLTAPPVFTVINPADFGYGSLRQAISDAHSGDTITFEPVGDITLDSGEMAITNNLTLSGPGLASGPVRVHGASSRVFRIGSGATVSISGLAIQDGQGASGAASSSKALAGGSGESGGGIYNDGTLTLSNCVIVNNHAGAGGHGFKPNTGGGGPGGAGGVGGGVYNAGTLTLIGCTVSDNSAGSGGTGGTGGAGQNLTTTKDGGTGGAGGLGGNGGGIYNSGTIIAIDSMIQRNTPGGGGQGGVGGDAFQAITSTGNGGPGGRGGNAGSGGGIYLAGMATVTNCTLSSNSTAGVGLGGSGGHGGKFGSNGAEGAGGSAGFGCGIHNAGSLTINDSIIERNPGNPSAILSGGGGIYNQSTLTMNNCTVVSNSVPGSAKGGGIYNAGTLLAINHSVLLGNSAYSGGAIEDDNSGTLSLSESVLSSNSAANYGGGIDKFSSPLIITNSTFTHNSANNAGGGIFTTLATVTIRESQFMKNVATHGNGGGVVVEDGSLSLGNSTFAGNSANEGGAIFGDSNGTLQITNSTLAGNSAVLGGGISLSSDSSLTLNSSTLSGNFGATSGSGVYSEDSQNSVTLINSIVAGNTGSANVYGDVFSNGHNLTAGNPLLAALGNYGGPTETMPPLAGSPALDYGGDSVANSLLTDQRGYPRKSGVHVDIGAVEVQWVPAQDRPLLASPAVQADGAMGFSFTNIPGADFTVLASTNAVLPWTNWTVLGLATVDASGRYQFSDPDATNYSQRYYQVVSP